MIGEQKSLEAEGRGENSRSYKHRVLQHPFQANGEFAPCPRQFNAAVSFSLLFMLQKKTYQPDPYFIEKIHLRKNNL
jgi:hypothetical protein